MSASPYRGIANRPTLKLKPKLSRFCNGQPAGSIDREIVPRGYFPETVARESAETKDTSNKKYLTIECQYFALDVVQCGGWTALSCASPSGQHGKGDFHRFKRLPTQPSGHGQSGLVGRNASLSSDLSLMSSGMATGRGGGQGLGTNKTYG